MAVSLNSLGYTDAKVDWRGYFTSHLPQVAGIRVIVFCPYYSAQMRRQKP